MIFMHHKTDYVKLSYGSPMGLLQSSAGAKPLK